MQEQVAERYPLPDIAASAQMGPMDAFRAFFLYAQQAFGDSYARSLRNALQWDRQKVTRLRSGISVEYLAEDACDIEAGRLLRTRFAPLLPAVRDYSLQRKFDPRTLNRIAWFIDQIEALPGAMEGKVWDPSTEHPNEGWWLSRPEPGLWKELRDGLVELMDEMTKARKPRGGAIEAQSTFLRLLGQEHLDAVLAGMAALGVGVVTAKGKGRVVGCMVAGLEYFSITIPPDNHWPSMLKEQFPGINASEKANPSEMRHSSLYTRSRTAMMDYLKSGRVG